MPSGLYYLNRSCQTEGLKITYLIFCGRTPEVRNAERMPEVRNAGTRKNAAQRVKMSKKKSDKREGSILKLGCSMTIS